MSEQVRIALVGATGLVGRAIIEQSVGRADYRLLALARREVPVPTGATMDVVVAEPTAWGEVMGKFRPQVLISALGTTIGKMGGDKDAFRAIDFDLVVDTARAAHEHGVERCVVVSSVNADPRAKMFYPKVKGEAEQALMKIGFKRLDLLRPGLLRGKRADDPRFLEKAAMVVSPLTDLLMQGKYRSLRSISAQDVAQAALVLAHRKANGRFSHEHDALKLAAGELPRLSGAVGEA
ncbi:NAD(P)H-binding protein [Parerythrobacter lacustris]|uniref:NAD(P)H-binding protein n=1 Tax=Parerythrobacter lacustris TaxID=2969984 RepID=A0ABT1XTN6_9SPHN|nr:NAD(P)H-binding protein [Parerythrobacter lacustris]MCR2835023.1 NAD(P)H-binding protein [Parerythrobacter lacustris]